MELGKLKLNQKLRAIVLMAYYIEFHILIKE